MSAAKRSRIEDLLFKDDPKDLVYFRIGKMPLMKIHKSVLVENSSVFKDAESVTKGDITTPITITDRTNSLSTQKAFLLFVRCLYEKDYASSLIEYQKVENNVNLIFPFGDVYIFADKYHVQWLIDECREVALVGLTGALKRYHLKSTLPKQVLAIIQRMDLEEQLMPAFKKAKLCFKQPEVVEKFKMCQEMGVDELTIQVVDYCCNSTFDPSWPEELSAMVMERLKNHVSLGKLKGVLTPKQYEQLPQETTDNSSDEDSD